jgi:murein L,D-transpeptidase YcbB/YkuD
LHELAAAQVRGLRSSDYQAAILIRTAGALGSSTAVERAAFDAALTSAATRFVLDLHLGRVMPKDVGYDLDVHPPAFPVETAVSVLASSTNVAAELDALEPQLGHYALLKTALAHYRELASKGPLPALPPLPGLRVRPGEPYKGAAALRSTLVALGDLAPSGAAAADTTLTPAVVEALQRFQSRHGLEADGVLGKTTYRALTTPLSARIQQIELSMERMRWLPAQLDSPPIIVNIPQFRLFAFRTTHDDAADILQMNVIVGEAFEARRTPVFAADMKYVVLNPYWDVPRSILLRELMPDIQRDPEWAAKHGYEIVRGESDSAKPLPATRENVDLLRQGKLRLRQKPGPANALGRVKFMFPNRHNVYLHDTSAPRLFLQSRRAFSHGCIRVSDPMALLAHVMRDDPTWTNERKELALSSGAPVRVPLKKPIRVFVLYGTALATEAGSVLFFDDLYGQDAPLIARLASRAT